MERFELQRGCVIFDKDLNNEESIESESRGV